MKFRTEIEFPSKPVIDITHSSRLLMLGSCFTDNIGSLLSVDGFDVIHNPMGPLYNPCSILHALTLACCTDSRPPNYCWHDNSWHCLDFASRYSANDIEELRKFVETDLTDLHRRIAKSEFIIITLGTSFVFSKDGDIVGNCHKLPATCFTRRMLSIDECIKAISAIVSLLSGKTVIFTISPIRHLADTLHGNQLSKATLLTSLNSVMQSFPCTHYFPAYEIMLDDLRDYRFYAADLKHPSETAIQYIYEAFAKYYFNDKTIEKAKVCRKQSKSLAHIPIITNATKSL